MRSPAATQTIFVSGTVSQQQSITAAPVAVLGSASLTGGANSFQLCVITEKSNNAAGYTVTIQSANAGTGNTLRLIGANPGGRNEITYTLSYGGVPLIFSGGQSTATDATSKTPLDGTSKNLAISIPANQNAGADTYSDHSHPRLDHQVALAPCPSPLFC